MKVAVLTQHFPTSFQQWAGHSTYQTLRILAERCDLRVFYPEATYPPRLTPKGKHSFPLDRTWNPAGVQASYIPYLVMPVLSRPINGYVIARKMLPQIRNFQPDIILNYFVYPDGYAAVRIGKALNVPVVLTAVGSDLNRITDPIRDKLTRFALHEADFVSTVSDQLRDMAISLGSSPEHTRTKLNGCDTKVFHPRDRKEARAALGLDPDAEIIVYVGRLDVRKGLLELIQAMEMLGKKHPNVVCYIVGDGEARYTLMDAIAEHNGAKWIRLIRSCVTDRIALWMAASDIVTLPSYSEGCPNVIIEALAAGRPIVATNVGGIPDLMDDSCGQLIPPRDIPALTQALDEVLTQSWDPVAISAKHGRSWTNVADELYEALEETLQRKK